MHAHMKDVEALRDGRSSDEGRAGRTLGLQNASDAISKLESTLQKLLLDYAN